MVFVATEVETALGCPAPDYAMAQLLQSRLSSRCLQDLHPKVDRGRELHVLLVLQARESETFQRRTSVKVHEFSGFAVLSLVVGWFGLLLFSLFVCWWFL